MGKQGKQWQTLFFGDSKITADGDCSHEIKRRLLLGKKVVTNLLLLLLSRFSHVQFCETPWTAAHKAPPSLGFSRQEHWSGLPFPSPKHESEKWKVKVTNLDSILKSRDITLPTKVHLVKAIDSPVVMYGCESWTVKKAECWSIDTFELWCWRRLLRFPWTARRSNQFVLKDISPGCFWRTETPILWPPHAKSWLIGKDSDAGRDWGQEEKGTTEDEMAGWHRQLDGHEFGWTLEVGDG